MTTLMQIGKGKWEGVSMNDEVLILGGNRRCGMLVEDVSVSGIQDDSPWAEIHDDMVAVEHSAREIILDGQLRVHSKEHWCLELI